MKVSAYTTLVLLRNPPTFSPASHSSLKVDHPNMLPCREDGLQVYMTVGEEMILKFIQILLHVLCCKEMVPMDGVRAMIIPLH